jgi:hypothetical protein
VHWLNRAPQHEEYWLDSLAAGRIASLADLPWLLAA